MRKILFLLFSLILVINTAAFAEEWIGDVFAGTDGWISNVRTWDWEETGSGVTIGFGAGSEIPVGTVVEFYYQARLVKWIDNTSSTIITPGLNTSYEYTVVAKIQEEVIASSGTDINGDNIPDLFNLTIVPVGGEAYLLYDTSPDSNVTIGSGFDDYDKIAVIANIIPNTGLGTFTFNALTGSGAGGTAINFFVNPAVVDTTLIDTSTVPITDLHFESNQNIPPLNSDTNSFFGPDAGGIYDVFIPSAGDQVYKVDGQSFFTTSTCAIDIEKLVREDDTADQFVDADECTDAEVPVIQVPGGAEYELIIENKGDSILTNCRITDAQLDIDQTLSFDLAPNSGPIPITSGDIGFENLDQPDRCVAAGELENTATITCDCADVPGWQVDDADDACIICEEPPTGQCRVTHGTITVMNEDGSVVTEGGPAEVTQIDGGSNGNGNGNGNGKNAKVSSNGGSNSDGSWYNWSGQLGAPQANDPSFGENEINQHNHPLYGDFAFHMGTHSASEGTEISKIECSDPGWCENARCAPFKQIFWEGIGEFENLHNNNGWDELCANVAPKSGHGNNTTPGTLHYARGHATDFGEPAGDFTGNPGEGPQPSADQCVIWGSGGLDIANTVNITGPNGETPPGPGEHHGDKGGQDCENCPDFFEFEIHCTTDPNSDVIWAVSHFITRGNIQIHPEVTASCQDFY